MTTIGSRELFFDFLTTIDFYIKYYAFTILDFLCETFALFVIFYPEILSLHPRFYVGNIFSLLKSC